MSLACVRTRLDDGKTFVGCGRGWEQPEGPQPTCERCGRLARITGTYSVISIEGGDA